MEWARLIISIVGLVISTVSLVGTFSIFLSFRAAAFGQIYQRWQNLTLHLANHPEVYEAMKTQVYDPQEASSPQLFAASAMLNYYEEAYLLINSKSHTFYGRLFSRTYFESVRNAARDEMATLRYLQTYWLHKKGRFSSEFNAFVEQELCPPHLAQASELPLQATSTTNTEAMI